MVSLVALAAQAELMPSSSGCASASASTMLCRTSGTATSREQIGGCRFGDAPLRPTASAARFEKGIHFSLEEYK